MLSICLLSSPREIPQEQGGRLKNYVSHQNRQNSEGFCSHLVTKDEKGVPCKNCVLCRAICKKTKILPSKLRARFYPCKVLWCLVGYWRDYLLGAVIVQLNSNTESTLSLGRGLEAVFRWGGRDINF